MVFSVFVLFLLLGPGCKAQSATVTSLSPEVKHRIVSEIRSRYHVGPDIDVTVSDPKPSNMPGYDQIAVTLSGGSHSSNHDFLISTDRKTLAYLDKIDLSNPMEKIDVKGRPVRGNPNAKVTIVNYDDFECPFCSRMHATLFPSLFKDYGDRVKIIYKDFPLYQIHPWAIHAAVDANCLVAQNNDAYWEFADYVHGNQKLIGGAGPGEAYNNLDKTTRELGAKHKLDDVKLEACLKKQDDSAVRASMAEGEKLQIDSTPTLFVNDERLAGAVPEEEMRSIIDRALADAGEKPPASNAKK